MGWIDHLWAINLIGGCVGVAGALQLWGRRKEPRIKWLMVLVLAISEWTLAYALALKSPEPELKELFLKLEVLGIVLISPSLFFLACHTSGRQAWLKPRLMALFGLVPLLAFSLAMTNQSHHLMMTMIWTDPGSPVPRYELGWAAIALNVVYSFIVVSFSLVLLIEAGLPHGSGRKGRNLLLLAGIVIPSAVSILDLLGLLPLHHADPTPLALSLSGLFLVYAVLRHRLYDTGEEPRDELSEELGFRMGMLRILFICGMPTVGFFLVYHLFRGDRAASLFLLGLACISLAGFLLLQSSDSVERLNRRYRIFASLFLVIFGSLNVFFSGFQAEVDKAPWIFLFPLLAVYIFGAREGLLWTAGLVLALIPALLLGNWESWAQASGPGFRFLVTFSLATLLVFLLERKREASVREVFRHREGLLEFESRFNLATEAGEVRVWEWNLAENRVRLDPELSLLPELKGSRPPRQPEEWIQRIHPQDRDRVVKTVQEALAEGRELSLELRLNTQGGDFRWVEVRGSVVAGKRGRPEKVVGTATDITQRKQAELNLRGSEERYRNLVEQMREGLLVSDREGRVTYLNDALSAMLGYTREEVQGLDLLDLVAQEHRPKVMRNLRREGRGRSGTEEMAYLAKDGRRIQSLSSFSPVLDRSGRYDGELRVIADISDLKEAQEELKLQKEYFENLIETSPEAIAVVNQESKVIRINREFEILFGYRSGEARGRLLDELIVPRELAEEGRALGREARSGVQVRTESVRQRKDGSKIHVSILLTAIRGDDGMSGVYAIYRDITREKEAEQALKQSYQILVTILDSIAANVFVADLRTHEVLFMSQHMAADFGKNMEGLPCYQVLRGGDAPCNPCVNERLLDEQGEAVGVVSWEGRNPLTGRWYLHQDRVIRWVDGRQVKLQVAADVSELKRTQEELAESERKYRELINSISDFLFTHDLEGRFLSINIASDNLLGYPPEEVIGRSLMDLIPERHHQAFYDEYLPAIKEEGGAEGLFRVVARDGGSHYIEYRNSLVRPDKGEPYVSGVGRDVTERFLAEKRVKVLQEQLYQARKMEAIGTLAGGVAHDFNNSLMTIIGYTELVRDDLDKGSPSRKWLDQVLKAGQRSAELVHQILSFSRRSLGERKPLKLGSVLEEALDLYRETLPAGIRLEARVASEGLMMADPAQIQQLLTNLCANSVQAMADGGGSLKIVLDKVVLDEKTARRNADLEEGPYLRLRVQDTGSGIDPNIMGRIFEPFFTTRGQGQSNGMGLAVVHGIVKSHGGAVEVESEPGQGTIFTVYLPEIGLDRTDLDLIETASRSIGSERIMFVGAETSLARFGQETLQRLGYRAASFDSSRSALAAFEKTPDSFDLIITDQSMPQLTGLEMTRRMRALRPDLPVILCTGFDQSLQEEEAWEAGISRLLTKPLSMGEMAAAIREVLGKEGSRS